MKKVVFILAAAFMAVIVNAQPADFTGKWKLNNSESKLNDQFTFAPGEVIINQEANSINVEKHSNFQGEDFTTIEKYSLDGQECVNEVWQGSKKKSVATWDGKKQLLTVKSKLPIQDGEEISITEVYKLEDNDLVVESNTSSSFGDSNETIVYKKQ